MSFNLSHFETFLTVAENQSITLAAQQLAISKAAVSQAIKQLEKSLQLPLFIRSTRSIQLTEEGVLLAKQCKKLHYELETARGLVANFASEPTGELRISCNSYFAQSHLLSVLEHYQSKFPQVTIDLLFDERMPDMDKEKIDIVCGINWPAPLDIVAKTIGHTRYVLCASPHYLQKYGTPKTIKDLETHRYIPHSGRKPQNPLADLKHPIQLKLNSPLRANNAQMLKQFALNHFGIIQLHDYMVEHELKSGALLEILPNYFNPQIPLYVYYQKHRYVQPKIRQFINLL